jgi:hypothetical protein
MNIQDLHNEAIEKMDLALIKKFKKDYDSSLQFFKEAFHLEKQAALLAKNNQIGEPSESILLKSAAHLALDCKEFREAEKLISIALSGEPPFEIAEELRNLLEEVNFHRHLYLQGIVLNSSELQLVLAGNAVSYGMAKSDQVFERINSLEKLTYRTAERIAGFPFRKSGNSTKLIKMNFEPYLSLPRAGSLAFTIRIGTSTDQKSLPGLEAADNIIDDIFDNIQLINLGEFIELKNKIKDNNYFDNFLGYSKILAPDGNDINLVGLTTIRNGEQKNIEFTKNKKEIIEVTSKEKNKLPIDDNENEIVEFEGKLTLADDDNNKIKLTINDKTKHTIKVSDGLSEIVKKYFGENVIIKGKPINNNIELIDIDPA